MALSEISSFRHVALFTLILIGGSPLLTACERSCTDVGCDSNVRLELNESLPSGEYQLSATLDDETRECLLSLDINGQLQDESVVCLEENNLRFEADNLVITGTPQSILLTIEYVSSGQTVSESFTPEYVTNSPNGKKCDPTCRNAAAVFDITEFVTAIDEESAVEGGTAGSN